MKYKVQLSQTVGYRPITVEAKDEDEAREKGQRISENGGFVEAVWAGSSEIYVDKAD